MENEIDKSIRSGKYSRSFSKKDDYNKCNLFVCDVLKKGWDIEVPKMKDEDYRGVTSSGGKKDDWPENPMSAVGLHGYYSERSALPNSGVSEVDVKTGMELSKAGAPVVVLGAGHATLIAADDAPWPLIYRSDLADRGEDKRTRVGMKDPDKFRYFAINPPQYKEFNKKIKDYGFTDNAVVQKYEEVDGKTQRGSNYTKLREKLISENTSPINNRNAAGEPIVWK